MRSPTRPCQALHGYKWPRKKNPMILSHFEITTLSSIWRNFHCQQFLFDQEQIFLREHFLFSFATCFVRYGTNFVRERFLFHLYHFYSCFHANNTKKKNNKASFRTFEQSSRSKKLFVDPASRAKNGTNGTKNVCKQNMFQIEQQIIQREQKMFANKICS